MTPPSSRRADSARADLRRMLIIISVSGVLLTAGALWYLSLFGELHLHMVIATIAGVFLSVMLGCGLFAAAFFSDKSGHDEQVNAATTRKGKDG